MPSTLQTVAIPHNEAVMFNHNRASLKALATTLGVETRIVMAHAIREGLAALVTSTGGGDVIDDLIADAEAEVA